MSLVSRGFGRRRSATTDDRLPPGQYDTGDRFPVLSAGPTPRTPLAQWDFVVRGEVAAPQTWTWEEFRALPREAVTVDIHCVTTWSKFDTVFGGVSVDSLLDVAQPTAEGRFVMATSKTGYTTNLPIEDVTGGKAWIVWEFDGKPLTAEHGGPVRMLVPHLYFWKSAKWISRITVMKRDQQGFWEQNGYHDRGDPWKQQRYQGD
jgi:DMSO/TMAO reductase YedYZ molybdopterin-dependent catalytic subunit